MKIKDMVDEVVESGITPISLSYDTLRIFDERFRIMRSQIVIESLQLGILTQKQYRFVARRSKKGEALMQRHIGKLFLAYSELTASSDVDCITLPVYPKPLLSGELTEMLFRAKTAFPEVNPAKICIEVSADILYEDLSTAQKRLNEIRDIGFKTAMFEVGDGFCPVFRLAELPLDYIFADPEIAVALESDETSDRAKSLATFLHLSDKKVFAVSLSDTSQMMRAKTVGFDGYGMLTEEGEAYGE